MFQSIYDRFYSRLGQSLGFYEVNAYDAYWIYALSVLEAGSSDAMSVRSVLADVASEYQGASGLCIFDDAGDRIAVDYNIWGYGLDEYNDGEFVKYGTYYWETDTVEWIQEAHAPSP